MTTNKSIKNRSKKRERQVANFFGSERTPLSGGNSKHTRSDTLCNELFVEHKDRKSHAVYNLFLRTAELAKAENKIPVVTLSQKGCRGFLVVTHCKDLTAVANIREQVRKK
jgi:hypothetical protein